MCFVGVFCYISFNLLLFFMVSCALPFSINPIKFYMDVLKLLHSIAHSGSFANSISVLPITKSSSFQIQIQGLEQVSTFPVTQGHHSVLTMAAPSGTRTPVWHRELCNNHKQKTNSKPGWTTQPRAMFSRGTHTQQWYTPNAHIGAWLDFIDFCCERHQQGAGIGSCRQPQLISAVGSQKSAFFELFVLSGTEP